MILKCVKVVAAAAFALVSLNVSGQDLLARQAPICLLYTSQSPRDA